MPMLSPSLGVRVHRLADIGRVGGHLDGRIDLACHVARMPTSHAAAHTVYVAVGSG